MSAIHNYLADDNNRYEDKRRLFKPVVCKDGFEMSVQCSPSHFCSHGIFPDYEEYDRNLIYSTAEITSFEVGFPSEGSADLAPYKDGFALDTQSIYVWVPTDVINKIIADHGGLK